MSWLRLDDGFAQHPKISCLTDAEFRVWIRLLCWAARYRTKDIIPPAIPGLTKKKLERFGELGLLDLNGDTHVVHDWHVYNPNDQGAAERMHRLRSRAPQPGGPKWKATRQRVFDRDQGMCTDCGKQDKKWNADHEPHREDLIDQGLSIYDEDYIVTRCPSCHATKTRHEALQRGANGTEHTPNDSANSSPPSRVGARARPVPSPTPAGSKGVGLSADVDSALEDPDKSEPVGRLLAALEDRDKGTEKVLRSLVRKLPKNITEERALSYVRDEVVRTGAGSGRAVRILQRIVSEGELVTPGFDS